MDSNGHDDDDARRMDLLAQMEEPETRKDL
jgi:hypothetical protein